MQTGLVFNIQKYSVSDGPGIRTTVFLKGCPLRCAWCHNPESLSFKPEIVVLERRCIACGECRKNCPQAANRQCEPSAPTSETASPALSPREPGCTLCGACIDACPTQGRQMVGREMSVQEVLEAVLQDQVFYQESGGGVTFSGGEPLMQPDFLKAALAACRSRGLHTAVDTCGLVHQPHLLEVAALTDLFLYDLKFMDPARHLEYTGASNEQILDNLQRLDHVHSNIWIRIPVIPGVNDGEENLQATARFVKGLQGVRQVNLLPYHNTGAQKAQRLGRTFELNPEPPTPEAMSRAAQLFRDAGLTARIGG
jgi:pyruvate formate lyase activating enzyme